MIVMFYCKSKDVPGDVLSANNISDIDQFENASIESVYFIGYGSFKGRCPKTALRKVMIDILH